jgi:hypothetical protein
MREKQVWLTDLWSRINYNEWKYEAGAPEEVHRARRMLTEVSDVDLLVAQPYNKI